MTLVCDLTCSPVCVPTDRNDYLVMHYNIYGRA